MSLEYPFSSSGKIISSGEDQKPGWFYLQVDKQISEYYRWLYSRAFKNWYSCLNGCHLTFIAGEKDDRIINIKELDSYLDKEIEFKYDNQICTNGRAFWLPAESEALNEIRRNIGLLPRLSYHVTLGNIKNENRNTY